MIEKKKFKVGEWGRSLGWYMKYDDGTPVEDLDDAQTIKIIMVLNDKQVEDDMTLVNVSEGFVKWTIPQGTFDSPGLAFFEVEATYSNKNDITNTFVEEILPRIKKEG